MNTKIECPKCGRTNCTTIDNEPLSHDKEWLTKNGMQFDNQLYVFFRCNDCDNRFRGTLEIITQSEHKALTGLQSKFPNGFASWIETHHEVVAIITNELRKNEREGSVIWKRQIEQGTGGMFELAEEWTDEFEKKNIDREWDGEFFEEVEDFCIAKDKAN
jgi:hypothetical protein